MPNRAQRLLNLMLIAAMAPMVPMAPAAVRRVLFDAPTTFVMPTDPLQVIVADFNGDGKPDMAAYLFASSRSIAVAFGNGQGSFRLKSTFTPGFVFNTSMAAADFNGDGKDDLALTDGTSLSVYLSNGDGTFRLTTRFSLPAGTSASAVTVADLNGDGKPDLFTVGSGIGVFIGNGNGTFQPGVVSLANQSTGQGFALADFNGDGKLDLAVQSTNNVVILTGNGAGTFQVGPSYPAAGNWMVAADLNGDGKVDLAINGTSLSMLPGNGDGTFGTALQLGSPCRGCSMASGDFNGDGNPDLIFGSNFLFLLAGNGNGTFQPIQQYFAGQVGISSMAVADLNGDGVPDILASVQLSFGAGTISAFLGVRGGPLQHAPNFAAGMGPNSVAIADFNNDGHDDVVVANWNNSGANASLSLLLGNGDGTLQAQIGLPTVPTPYFVVAGDFNHDGRADLAVASYNSQTGTGGLYILLGNGNGTFQAPQLYETGAANCIAIGDLNGDGVQDLAVTSFGSPGRVSILRGRGDGTFRRPLSYAVGVTTTAVAIGDFDGDGKQDLAVADSTNNAVWLLNGYGDGTFKPGASFETGKGPVALAAADFRGTGKSDLVAGTAIGIAILLNDGKGNLLFPIQYALPTPATSVLVKDLNHDGQLDVAAAFSDGVALVLGKGHGLFDFESRKFLADNFAQAIAVGNLNADRKPDLAVANSQSNDVSILINATR